MQTLQTWMTGGLQSLQNALRFGGEPSAPHEPLLAPLALKLHQAMCRAARWRPLPTPGSAGGAGPPTRAASPSESFSTIDAEPEAKPARFPLARPNARPGDKRPRATSINLIDSEEGEDWGAERLGPLRDADDLSSESTESDKPSCRDRGPGIGFDKYDEIKMRRAQKSSSFPPQAGTAAEKKPTIRKLKNPVGPGVVMSDAVQLTQEATADRLVTTFRRELGAELEAGVYLCLRQGTREGTRSRCIVSVL